MALVLEVSLSAIHDQPGQDAQSDGRVDTGLLRFAQQRAPLVRSLRASDQPSTMQESVRWDRNRFLQWLVKCSSDTAARMLRASGRSVINLKQWQWQRWRFGGGGGPP